MKSNKKRLQNNSRVVKYAILSLGMFLVVFTILGNFKGWRGCDIIPLISIYAGGSILELDQYFLSTNEINDIFDQESLIGIDSILYRIGFYDIGSFRILEFIGISPKISTNVYTGLRRYIQDFGYGGMIIVQFCLWH
jgi:oligosaccharide repeat unit polymerase